MHRPYTCQEVASYNATAIIIAKEKRARNQHANVLVKGHKCLICGEWLWTATTAHANKHGYESVGDMVDAGVMIKK